MDLNLGFQNYVDPGFKGCTNLEFQILGFSDLGIQKF